MDTFTMK